jgi:hypothetical protein
MACLRDRDGSAFSISFASLALRFSSGSGRKSSPFN